MPVPVYQLTLLPDLGKFTRLNDNFNDHFYVLTLNAQNRRSAKLRQLFYEVIGFYWSKQNMGIAVDRKLLSFVAPGQFFFWHTA